jgi:hypothetical protein
MASSVGNEKILVQSWVMGRVMLLEAGYGNTFVPTMAVDSHCTLQPSAGDLLLKEIFVGGIRDSCVLKPILKTTQNGKT